RTSYFELPTSNFRLAKPTVDPQPYTDLRREVGGHLQVRRPVCGPVGESGASTPDKKGHAQCCGKVFNVPSGSRSSAIRSPIGSDGSTRSRSSAASARQLATRCGACCSRRLRARRL